jgi:hypothetical protein
MTTPSSTTPTGLHPPVARGVYLICFDAPYFHARHYVGYSDNIAQRLEMHRAGHGSPLLAAVLAAGIDWHLVQVWPGADRTFERKLHNRHGSRLCPLAACQAVQRARRCQRRLGLFVA